jgi:glycosyltransferase involved in cell wall biosynthesis
MACGTAVIASNRGALAETLGNAAIMVDAEDAEAIAEAIVRVVGDGCLREKHIQMGLEQSASLRWDKAAKETLFVYEEAAGCNGQR